MAKKGNTGSEQQGSPKRQQPSDKDRRHALATPPSDTIGQQGWVAATANVAALVEEATRKLQTEIATLQAEVRKLQADLAQVERRNRVALTHIVPERSGRLARLLPGRRKLPAWVREQVETLRKSRLFDTDWYLSHNPDVQSSGMDALSHFVLIGGFEGRKPNPVFDSRWYLETYPDVAQSGLNPLFHYFKFGAADKRAAGPSFDTAYYLERSPDVAASGMNPLVHYLRHGMKEGRIASRSRPLAKPPAAPEESVWSAAKPRANQAGAVVDIIVPVYRGYDDTLACIHSVLAAPVTTAFELVVIDDASPERALSAKLAELARMGLFTLLVNPRNLGFVGTVNRGMGLHADRDVVLLNSDTEVYNDWLDRLRSQAQGARVGSVTPFSTNATICSYPVTLRDNPEELEISFDALDSLAATANAGQSVDIPTAVGFCMYIPRACLKAVGLFDAETFGKGYGEENDFCRRAANTGWRNILAGDVFVRHTGEVSFADQAGESQTAAAKALLAKHPDYNAVVRDHIRSDPAARLRRRLDAARLKAHCGERSILHVTHNWGGGIGRHVQNMVEMLARDGVGGLLMTNVERGKPQVGIHSIDDINAANLLGLDIIADAAEIADLLPAAGVVRIHVHSLAGFPLEATDAVRRIAGLAGLAYDFTVHDYMAFCPRLTLVNGNGRYCGEKGLTACHSCIAVNGTPFGRVNANQWRRHFLQLLDGASHVFAPSRDACRRTSSYLRGREVLYRPHPHKAQRPGSLAMRWKKDDIFRIMIVGGINEQKGSRLLLAMAEDATRRKLPIEFTIVGHTDQDAAFAARANVTMTGRYREDDLFQLMRAQAAHAFFLSSLSPETFSYVLTAALEAGYPVAAFDLGAQAERLRELAPDTSLLLDEGLAGQPAKVNRALLEWIRTLKLPDDPPQMVDVTYAATEYYAGPLETNSEQD
ncbi:MAG: glycosyltransferase [Alphaproteobacteria bacterium]|nr:glycosyltransferase [Alphaproteobacteria bacterium]